MIAVIQRVRQASITMGEDVIAAISRGLVVLVGIARGDTIHDVDYLAEKIPRLRIFPDSHGNKHESLRDVQGELLMISQFTLLATTKKGRRPNFDRAAPPEEAYTRYRELLKKLQASGLSVQEGLFGATMVVSLENDGPVTLILDSRAGEAVKKIKDSSSGTDTVFKTGIPEKGESFEREGRA